MKTYTTLATTAAVFASVVHGHGGMIEPAPRALTTMGLSIENTFGFPISMRGDYTNGLGGDCLDFTQDTNLQELVTGRSTIKMRANDGANHIGPCTAYLVDPRDKNNKVQVGQLDNCMRSLYPGPGNKGDPPIPAEMAIDVPTSGLPCDDGHCVFEWYWEATHLSPPELFNNCADVMISGAGGDSDPAPDADSNTEADATPEPAESGSYIYIGSSPDVDSLTQWCNWNCPQFCPEDMCQEV